MAKVGVTSFTCRDEQEFLQDEAYVVVNSDNGYSKSQTYGYLDTGDTIFPGQEPIPFVSWATVGIWEDDGPEGVSSEDDLIGFASVDPNIGTHTVTLQGSGGEYDLTYLVA